MSSPFEETLIIQGELICIKNLHRRDQTEMIPTVALYQTHVGTTVGVYLWDAVQKETDSVFVLMCFIWMFEN